LPPYCLPMVPVPSLLHLPMVPVHLVPPVLLVL
jgi:hypothetical protein